MKSQVAPADIITFLVISVIFVLTMSRIPKIYKEFFSVLALSTSDVVAHDLAGLISMSAAAPDDIIIEYHGRSEQINYTVELKDRDITVEMIVDGEPQNRTVENVYAVSDLQGKFEDCKKFEIKKIRTGLDNYYYFNVIE